jgi:hypothetical protein
VSSLAEKISAAIGTVMNFMGVLWRLRRVLIGVWAATLAYKTVMTGWAFFDGIIKSTRLLAVAEAVRTGILGFLTGGNIALKGAMAETAVVTGAATKAQWLLNFAMNANPLVLVTLAAVALISVIVIMVRWWKAATAGVEGFGNKIWAFVLYPMQSVIRLLAKLPGKAGEEFKKMDKIMDNYVGRDLSAKVKVETESPISDFDETILAKYGIRVPDMTEWYELFDASKFGVDPALYADGLTGGKGGKSKLHGVTDISGGASIPGLTGTPTGTAIGGATGSSISESAALASILSVVRHIDGSVAEIVRMPRLRTASSDAGSYDAGSGDINPRNIAPVTQAERVAYSIQERRETVVIEVAAAQGTEARIVRSPKNVNIRLVHSGANHE